MGRDIHYWHESRCELAARGGAAPGRLDRGAPRVPVGNRFPKPPLGSGAAAALHNLDGQHDTRKGVRSAHCTMGDVLIALAALAAGKTLDTSRSAARAAVVTHGARVLVYLSRSVGDLLMLSIMRLQLSIIAVICFI